MGFNSRPSCDGRPEHHAIKCHQRVSIHARRVTGDMTVTVAGAPVTVSIHARRVTGDIWR